MPFIQRVRRTWLPILLLGVAVGVVLIVAGWRADAAEKFIKYNFSQSQTQLSIRVESSQAIKSAQWSYAGPLDDRKDCSNRIFGSLPAAIKGKADVSVSEKNSKVGSAKLPIQRSDNNKYYCLLVEGYPVVRSIDYNPPTIKLEGSNHLVGTDRGGLYGPSGVVNSKSWQAATFDISKKSGSYGCNPENNELNFRRTPADIKYVGQYSWGNHNHVSYNVPGGSTQFIAEFFESLKNALYAEPETNLALIPFVDGRYSEIFTDNIHLCHRVSDPQGNTTYKLMRLDLGGPAIKLTLADGNLQASSPAVDLDDSTWQYYKIPHRRNRYICDYLDYPPEATGETDTVANVQDGDWYCFWALDKQGSRNTRLIQIDTNAPIEAILPSIDSNQVEEVEEGDPPETTPEETEDDTPPVGQQSHLDGGSPGSNEVTLGNTEEPADAVEQPNQTPPAVEEQPQTALEESSPTEQEPDVALQSSDDARSAGQTFSQTSEPPAVFRYLIFILIGLAAGAIILTFIFLKTAPTK